MRVTQDWLDARLQRAADGTMTPTARRRPAKPPEAAERDIQAAVLKMLRLHPRVAWAQRMNSGVFKVGELGSERWVRAAFRGCSDILGQMRDGRLLAVECKRRGEKPTAEQGVFLEHVRGHGGVAFVARSIDDVVAGLGGAL